MGGRRKMALVSNLASDSFPSSVWRLCALFTSGAWNMSFPPGIVAVHRSNDVEQSRRRPQTCVNVYLANYLCSVMQRMSFVSHFTLRCVTEAFSLAALIKMCCFQCRKCSERHYIVHSYQGLQWGVLEGNFSEGENLANTQTSCFLWIVVKFNGIMRHPLFEFLWGGFLWQVAVL